MKYIYTRYLVFTIAAMLIVVGTYSINAQAKNCIFEKTTVNQIPTIAPDSHGFIQVSMISEVINTSWLVACCPGDKEITTFIVSGSSRSVEQPVYNNSLYGEEKFRKEKLN